MSRTVTARTDVDTSVEGSTNELDGTILGSDEKDLERGDQMFQFQPIRSISRPTATTQSRSLYPTQSHQSTGGEDGYSVRRNEESEDDGLSIDANESPEQKEEREFEVKWDSENDPMNPRCKKKWRKWLIVIIVAACSLCV